MPQGLSPRRACPVRRKRYRGARKGRRRVPEGNPVTVPENGHHPGLGSYRLPPPPVQSQAPPNSQRESCPVKSTFSRLLCLYLRSGRSLRRKRKREPYTYSSSSSYQTGQKGKKTMSASELQKSSPAQRQMPTIQQTPQPPQVSEESWMDGGYVAQERRSQPHASWSTLNPAGETERERPSQEEENTSCATSSAGTVERTSASRESCLESTRLPRAVQPWLARNSKALEPERINRSKSARTSSGRCSRKPPHVDSHQSSRDETSQTQKAWFPSRRPVRQTRKRNASWPHSLSLW